MTMPKQNNPLMCDGYDDAVIGVARRCGQPDLVVYDSEKIVRALVKSGMTRHEAFEYFEFNIAGAWVGEGTPLFLDKMPAEDVRRLFSDEGEQ